MKITRIHVNNYRILKNFDFDLEDELSLVIGKNNCGKTSLLSILEKFIGAQSATNNFSYNDFSSTFKDKLYTFISEKNKNWESELIKGIELFLYIQYDDKDNLSNIQPLILDLDPNNNTVVIKFEYVLSSVKLQKLKNDFNEYLDKYKKDINHSVFESFIRTKHRKYFESYRKAVLYDIKTKKALESEYSILNAQEIDLSKIICFHCISAHRDTVNKEGNSTLSQLSSRYYEKTKTDQENSKIIQFEETLQNTDEELTKVYEDLFENVINKIKKFGGIRENETVVRIISSLSQQQLLKGNTTVVYQNSNHELPESYNGLGYLNLISMIMELEIHLEDFLKKNDSDKRPADINILFIEEPEAHTHPQLQYVFIKNIKNLLAEGISDDSGKALINLQTIITTHSSHIVAECEFDDIKFFRRVDNTNVDSKNLKELEIEYKDEKDGENNHFKFLKQYLTLNCAEIFFADKVILYEGETEYILLPAILKKIDEEHPTNDEAPMLSQNISFLASGAYSQIFDKFLSFIGIKTLIITDIDAGKKVEKNDKNGNQRTVMKACPVENGTYTSNSALKHYYERPLKEYIDDKKGSELDFFTTLSKKDKILCKDKDGWKTFTTGNMMVVYQTKENNYYPRSFEDAFIQMNRDFISSNVDMWESLKNKEYITEMYKNGNYKKDAYKIATMCVKSKSSFALDILLNSVNKGGFSYSNWKTPTYVEEGLLWLRKD
ncbi:AAA family ATPase [Faecalimonas sp.]